MLSSYFLELRTGTDYTVNDYDAARARLDASHKCASLSSPTPSPFSLTHDAHRESCHSEVEVGLESMADGGHELVAKAVVDIITPTRSLPSSRRRHCIRASTPSPASSHSTPPRGTAAPRAPCGTPFL